MEFVEKTKQFLLDANQELRRVTWPARNHVAASTWVVVGFVIVLAILLFLVDSLFARIIRWVLG